MRVPSSDVIGSAAVVQPDPAHSWAVFQLENRIRPVSGGAMDVLIVDDLADARIAVDD